MPWAARFFPPGSISSASRLQTGRPARETALPSARAWRSRGMLRPSGEWELGELPPALDHPVPSDMSDERRQDDHAQPLRDHVLEQQVERGNQHQQDRDLADLDPEIESE